MDTVEVIFVQHYEQYNANEIASFPKINAKKLVEKGLAEYYKR
jgi:hypothetical protein